MAIQSQPSGPTLSTSDIQRIVLVCECHLHEGNYSTCRDLAAKAQVSYPNHPGLAQILTICSILVAASSTPRPDWYSILLLPRFAEDQKAIKRNFYLLSDLLNPTINPYPMAAKAHEWVVKAWTILSEPSVKTLVDRELRMEETSEKNGAAFWTRCPNCYYMYEYEKKYQDCSLRCQNVKCRKAYTADCLPASAAPPPDLVSGDVYVCHTFSPLGLGREREGGSEGWKWWAPSVSTGSSPVENKTNVMEDEGLRNEKVDGTVKISDDEKEDKTGGCSGDVNHEEAKVNIVEKQNNGEKVVTKRKKMTAISSKKVMGRGTRVNLDEIFQEEVDDEADLEVESGGNSKDFDRAGIANGKKGVSDALN